MYDRISEGPKSKEPAGGRTRGAKPFRTATPRNVVKGRDVVVQVEALDAI